MLLRRDFDFLDQGFGGLRVRDLLGCVKHGVELHDLCEALGDDLAVVDVVLTVGVDQVVVETHLVLLEVGDRCIVNLQHKRADIHIVALKLLINILDLPCEISDRVHYRIL